MKYIYITCIMIVLTSCISQSPNVEGLRNNIENTNKRLKQLQATVDENQQNAISDKQTTDNLLKTDNLKNSIFYAIIFAAKGDKDHTLQEYSKAINKYQSALGIIEKYKKTKIGKRHSTIEKNRKNYFYGSTVAEYRAERDLPIQYFLHLNIGKSYIGLCQREGDIEECHEATNSLEKAIEILENINYKYMNRASADVYYHIGFAYMLMEKLDSAKYNFEKSKNKDINYVNSHKGLGILYSKYSEGARFANGKDAKKKKNFLNAAKKEFKNSLKIDSEYNDDNYNNLGEVEYRLGNYKQAIDYYTKALFINPIDPIFYYNRGLAHHKEKQYFEACHNYKIAIELQTEDSTNIKEEIKQIYNNAKMNGFCL